MQLILDKMVHGYTGGVEIPWCTHMVANTRLCHIRVNKGANLVEDWLPNLSLLGVTQSDILLMNFGAWWGLCLQTESCRSCRKPQS